MRIARIAGAQRGRVARRQLLAAGLRSSTIDRLLARGYLYREHNGVYVVGHSAAIPLGRETGALLACREGAVLSHLTAIALWNLLPAGQDIAPIDVLTLDHRSRQPGIRPHRTRHLLPRDIRIHQRLPVTSPARALLDAADLVTKRQLERALDEGLATRTVRISQVRDVVRRAHGRRATTLLTHLIDERTGPATITRSEAEERMLALIRQAELPAPEMNVPLHGYTVDFLWREARLVVEVDGHTYHSTKSAFERDRRKDATLQAAGWLVVRITWQQIENEPYAVIARLAQALAWSRTTVPGA